MDVVEAAGDEEDRAPLLVPGDILRVLGDMRLVSLECLESCLNVGGMFRLFVNRMEVEPHSTC